MLREVAELQARPERHRARAVAIWAGVAGSGAILGVLGSGVLLQLWSWQSIFVALTVAGVVLLIAALTVSESLEYAHPAMDYVGSVVVAAAVGFDFESGRLDTTPHPFFGSIGPGDVRLDDVPEEFEVLPDLGIAMDVIEA